MIWPGRNSRLIAVTFATRQTIDFRVKQVYMLCGHVRRTMYFASIAAGAQTLVMIVAHKDEARLPMLGQDDRLSAGSIGDVTNLFIEVTRRELAHGTNSDWNSQNIQIFYICKKNRLSAPSVMPDRCISLGGVALASGSVGQFLNRWPKLLACQERFTGIVMVGLGIRLLLSGSYDDA
jgi:hypothetical protein